MSTYKFLSFVVAVVAVLFVGMGQATAQDRCLLFSFKGTPDEIRAASDILREEMLKYPKCTEVKFDYADAEHKKELEKKIVRSLSSAEKEFGPPNRLSFSCLEQSENKNAFEFAGRAYLRLPEYLVTNSIELAVTTSCCTSTSCVSYQCPGEDVPHCWNKTRTCRVRCSSCNQ
jgi:hypothetical protein